MERQKTETQSNGVTEKQRLRDSEIAKWKDGETHRQRKRETQSKKGKKSERQNSRNQIVN